jgi:hypothetical protein
MVGYLPDAPAVLQQGDGNTASNFELEFGACGSHRDHIGRTRLSL